MTMTVRGPVSQVMNNPKGFAPEGTLILAVYVYPLPLHLLLGGTRSSYTNPGGGTIPGIMISTMERWSPNIMYARNAARMWRP